jgi:hypothetical protein
MLHLKFRPNIAHDVFEPQKPTVAGRFAQVLARLKLEYDLAPDVWAVAEDVLQALKAREENWSLQ